ncbi:MAG: AI-2E family transporter [Thermodesulfobacteriota bacterium]
MTVSSLAAERAVRMFTVALILSLTLLIVIFIDNLLLTFVLALVLTYLLSPVADALERAGMTRSTAVLCLYLAIGVLTGVAVWFGVPAAGRQLGRLQGELPAYMEGIRQLFTDLTNNLPAPLKNHLFRHPDEGGIHVMQAVFDYLFRDLSGIVATSLSTLIIAPVFAFFMLMDGRSAAKQLIAIVPNTIFETALNLQYQISTQIGGFIRARLLESAIVTLMIWAGLVLLDYPYALFLSVFAGLLNLIPYLGPIIGAVPAFLAAVMDNRSAADLLLVAGIYSLAQLIDAVIIVPLVVAKIVNLHAVIVIVVIIIGAEIGGILGMIVSVPAASIIKLTCTSIYQHLVGFRTS